MNIKAQAQGSPLFPTDLPAAHQKLKATFT
jgi:hypothetical protein